MTSTVESFFVKLTVRINAYGQAALRKSKDGWGVGGQLLGEVVSVLCGRVVAAAVVAAPGVCSSRHQ